MGTLASTRALDNSRFETVELEKQRN